MELSPFLFLLTFAGIQAIAAISPGPAFALLSQRSRTRGRTGGMAVATGCTVGICIFGVVTLPSPEIPPYG